MLGVHRQRAHEAHMVIPGSGYGVLKDLVKRSIKYRFRHQVSNTPRISDTETGKPLKVVKYGPLRVQGFTPGPRLWQR